MGEKMRTKKNIGDLVKCNDCDHEFEIYQVIVHGSIFGSQHICWKCEECGSGKHKVIRRVGQNSKEANEALSEAEKKRQRKAEKLKKRI